ncbi:MAG: hypothetical protein ACWGPS_05175 [Candidatus Promineifilaceae bacterium]
MFKMRWITILAIFVLVAAVIAPGVAWASPPAHEAPKGSEWVMADWMFLSFVVFAGVSFMAFLMALKAGWLSNLEEAKYPMLEIEEEDYYSPDWASEGGDQ